MKKHNLFLLLIIILFCTSCDSNRRIKLVNTNFNEEISQDQNLFFEFNMDMVPDTFINVWDTTEYIKFKPAIKGRYMWESARGLVFVPSAPFPPSTAFEAHFTRKLKKHINRNVRIPKESVKFNTPFLTMSSTDAFWTIDEEENNEVKLLVSLYFNYKVNPAEVGSKLTLMLGKDKFDFGKLKGNLSERIDITLPSKLVKTRKRQNIKVILEPGLTLPGSDYKTKDKIIQTVSIPSKEKIQVLAVEPYFEDGQGYVNVKLTQAFLNSNLNELINIEPNLKYSVEKQINGFLIKGDFIENNTYTLIISGKLKGIFGYEMGKDYSENISFGTLEPYLAFEDPDNIYLSSKGNRNIALRLINIPEVSITIFKIYENNMLHYLREGKEWDYYYDDDEWYDYYNYSLDENYGKIVFTKKTNTKNLPRRGNISLLNLSLNDIGYSSPMKGIYVIKVESTDKKYLSDVQLVSVSDLGMIVKKGLDKTYIIVNSILSAKPIDGVDIQAISSNNQVILQAKTNDKGVAVFDNDDPAFEGFQVVMFMARKGNDFNFIHLTQTMLEMSRFDVGGKRTAGLDYDVFLYGDRNLYRPGDSVYINAVVRDLKWQNQPNIPLKFYIAMPNGRKLHMFKKETNAQGAASVAFSVPSENMTGTYIAEVYSGNDVLLNTYRFAVEEFMPDRIKVDTKLDKEDYLAGDKVNVTITATNFFGPPATNRNTEVELSMKRKLFIPKGLEEYYFGIKTDHYVSFDVMVNENKTGEDGKVTEEFQLPENKGIGIIEGKIYTSVFDETGRAINRVNVFNIYTQQAFFGIHDIETWVSTRKALPLNFIAVNKKGQRLNNVAAKVEIRRYNWETVMENRNGRLYYNSQRREQIVVSKNISISSKGNTISYTPSISGEYEVRIYSGNSEGYVSRIFYAYGWSDTEYTSFKTDKEGHINITSDKESYESGESADLLFKTPFEGRIIVTVECGGVFNFHFLETKDKAASLRLSLNDEHLPNVYITATAIKGIGKDQNFLTVAHGVINLNVTKSNTKMKVTINAPEQIRSKQKQAIKVYAVPGAEVTLAIVDEGILQLSNYKSPDPHAYFYQKRALEVETYDIYKYLYPEIGYRSSPAGDISLDMSKRVNPLTNKRVKLLSLWSGQMKANNKGECTFVAHIPQFSGSVRIMAVAYKDKAFGSASKNMRVADPVVISSALPRFLSPGDVATMHVMLSNTSKKGMNLKVSLKVTGPIKINGEKQFAAEIKAGNESRLTFEIEAIKSIGEAKVTVIAQTEQETFSEETDINVRPPSGLSRIYGSGSVNAGKVKNIEVDNDFLDKNLKTTLFLSKSPMVEFGEDLNYLIRYPYGCLEQTISTAFPQLCLKELILFLNKKKGYNEKEIDYNVQQAVNKIQAMQSYEGSFSYWPGGYYYNSWSSVYAAHFLTEAKKAGYEVSPQKLEEAYTYLKYIVKNKAEDTWHYYTSQNYLQYKTIASRETFYANFVLSLVGKENRSVMNHYKANLDLLSTDSRFLLAAAYALTGDKNSYRVIVPKAWDEYRSVRAQGGSFYSWMRDKGIALYVLCETDPTNPLIPFLSTELSKELRSNYWYSTQERIFALLALGKLEKQGKISNIVATINIGNSITRNYNNNDLIITDPFNNKTVSISNKGNGILYYTYEIEGISASGDVDEKDENIMVRKKFYDRKGNPVYLKEFKQNDLIVVEITLRSICGKYVENVAITDLLPACFEIENPRLITERDMEWIKFRSTPDYMDIRDDRINFFTTASTMDKKFYYTVRAVTPGTFVMGPVSADAMYDGNYTSVSGSMTLTVK